MQNLNKKPIHLWSQDADEALAARDEALRRRAQAPPSKSRNWIHPFLLGGAVILGFLVWCGVQATGS